MKSPHAPAPAVRRRYLRHGLLPQLAAFDAVVRLGSAARAAEALCIAPSTLSGHLRKLSETLGVRLFELEGKQMVPTRAARPLVNTVNEVFDAFVRCEQALAPLRDADQRAGHKRIDNAASFGPPLF